LLIGGSSGTGNLPPRGLPAAERVAGPETLGGAWAEDVEADLAGRNRLDAAGYAAMRA
jgi:hypothetical protein